MTELLKLENVAKTYATGSIETEALTDASLTVRSGEFVAITGRSGSGKTTLLNLAGGLVQPSSGVVSIAGTVCDWSDQALVASLRRNHIGLVFQQFNLLPSLTAAENIALPMELDGTPSSAAFKLARTALVSVGLGDKADAFPDELSGGQQQRIAIARALVGQRRLVLADEPTGSVDDETGNEIIKLLSQQARDGAGVVMVTHDAAYASRADRIIHLRNGSIVSVTEPANRSAHMAEKGGV